jgi:eukaryotic-like serine/threonine-protein kinase
VNFTRARGVVDKVVTQAAAELADVPRVEPVRRALLESALRFYEGFLGEGVEDPAVRLETARAYQRVATIHGHLGHRPRSERAWQKAIDLLEKLAREFPARAQYREDLASCYASLADSCADPGRPDRAVEARRRQAALQEDLVNEFPDVPRYRAGLASAWVSQGMVLSADPNRQAEAEAAFRQAFRVHDRARSDFPGTPESPADLAYLHWAYGRSLAQGGRLPEAERHLRLSLDLYEGQAKKSGRVERWLADDISGGKEELAQLLNRTGRAGEAERYMREVNAALETQVGIYPYAVSYWAHLARHQEAWGLTLFGLNRAEEAERALRKCVENAAKLHEQTGEFTPDRAKGLAWGHYHLGELLCETGRADEAAEQFRRALGLFEQNAERFPDMARGHYHLAWVLGACPDPRMRDPGRAVRHAQRALDLGPETAAAWTCLGIAQFRAGQFRAAAAACEKGLRLNPDCDWFEWFFQAMAQWRLGQKERARESYATGMEWAKRRPVVELELRACRREAAVLLGVADGGLPPLTNSR